MDKNSSSLRSDLRDRELGAGYDYQWDVATYLIIAFVLRRSTAMPSDLREAREWLGTVEGVTLEGREADQQLEDFNIHGAAGRSVRIQVKERPEDVSQRVWREKDEKFVDFLNRIGHHEPADARRFMFLSNGGFHKDLRGMLSSRDGIASYYEEVIVSKRDEAHRAPRESFIANASMATVCQFISATPVAEHGLVDGVGRAIVNQLASMSVSEPEAAYVQIRDAVMRWSFRKGGTTLTVQELRGKVAGLLGVRAGPPGAGLVIVSDYLRSIPADSDNWPSWADLEAGRVWTADPAVDKIREKLDSARLAVIVGGQGTGKTVALRTFVFERRKVRVDPVYWDFEHLGALPEPPLAFLNRAMVHAAVTDCEPCIVLENVHLNVEVFGALLEFRQARRDPDGRPVEMIATSRVRLPERRGASDCVNETTIDLTDTKEQRGARLLRWWLETQLGLDDEARAAVLRAVPWNRLVHDLWVLKLALGAFDQKTRSVPMWGIERKLRERLEPTIRTNPGADDLLYLVSGLGACGVPTDLAAAARTLGMTAADTQRLAEAAHANGLVSLDTRGRTCRFWHDSLAEWYWKTFMLERGRWADAARHRLEGGAR